MAAALAGGAVLIIVLPLLEVIRYSLGASAAVYLDLLARAEVWRIIGATSVIALATAVLASLLGLTIAVVLRRIPPTLRQAIYLVFILSAFLPFIVRGFACVVILSATGPLNRLSQFILQTDMILLGTFGGVVVTLLHALLPVATIVIGANIDDDLDAELRIAATLGAGPVQRLLSITLPKLAPSVVSAFLVVFVISAGAFVAPAMVGGGRQTLAVQLVYIYHVHMMQPELAAALAVLITVLLLLVVAGLAWVRARTTLPLSHRYLIAVSWLAKRQTAYSDHVARAGVALGWLSLAAGMIIVIVPPFYVIAISLQPLPMLALPIDEISLRWYARVLGDRDWQEALTTTIWISTGASVAAVCLAAAAAEFGRRAGSTANAVIAALALAPAVVPPIVFAIGYYAVFGRLGMIGSGSAVIVAHAAITLPIAYLLLSSALSRYDARHEEVASSLGARTMRRFRTIRLRLLAPSFAAAALFAFLASFEEVVMTLFLAGMDIRTVGLKMWSLATQSIGPELAVPGTLLLIASLIVATVGLRLNGNGLQLGRTGKESR